MKRIVLLAYLFFFGAGSLAFADSKQFSELIAELLDTDQILKADNDKVLTHEKDEKKEHIMRALCKELLYKRCLEDALRRAYCEEPSYRRNSGGCCCCQYRCCQPVYQHVRYVCEPRDYCRIQPDISTLMSGDSREDFLVQEEEPPYKELLQKVLQDPHKARALHRYLAKRLSKDKQSEKAQTQTYSILKSEKEEVTPAPSSDDVKKKNMAEGS